ncbi:MAG TPA: PEP-CTERM sorting domain-containing protein [Phycisphaerales bacterium]|nr:PEP-CTERM sorting domain-containing protein [Phycisphaerales bacterium]HRQ75041.1 PEP-CTERM sorting domain-containing protein [Phycisphaerales bacterium]
MVRTYISLITSFLLAGSLNTAAFAGGGHHSDIEVGLRNNQLTTEGRVFEGEFSFTNGFWITDDPGFEGDAGLFAAGTTIGFNIIAALGLWNGNGFDTLDPFSHASITLELGPLSATTGAGFISGFNFVADASGGFDSHLDFILNGPDALAGEPADGVYLIELQLISNNYLASESFWIVFGKGADHREIDAAMDWVEANLVPAPGALLLLGMAAFGAARRRV